MHKALFLDRDGCLNDDTMYPHKVEHFKLLPGVIEGLKKLKKDYIFIIITNQSGIGRGIFQEEDMHKFNEKLLNELKKGSIEIKKIYYCPHAPEELCKCRKPHTKYVREAEKEFGIDIKNSWVMGDHPHDVEMGIKNGCKSVYLLTGHGSNHLEDLKNSEINPNFIANNFLEAADFIIKSSKTK
ncbi:HAD family hydrolase [Candidatus Woesearchaeota archaeon]|nr:HAD family hydrolase [Candidatus Woesearchaeota archaeon]